MPYETPITIKQALERIQGSEYVLPAIQREFVWGPDRVIRLFDSLMRGYPIGGFLLWRLSTQMTGELDLYRFLDRYSEFDHRHNDRLTLIEPRPLHAVLDGQQRLTALNIALRGTYAYRLPRKWANKADSFPERKLYFELCGESSDADTLGEGLQYLFDFLRPSEVPEHSDGSHYWFPVPEILHVDSIAEQIGKLTAAGLSGATLARAAQNLEKLRDAVHKNLVVAAHVEEDQDLDRVLDIFIRVNSAGMTLSSSDLLLSIATARWKDRDARESIYNLVDELNSIGHGFAFNKDLVLKAALVLTDAKDIRFKASNINPLTMAKVEENWDAVEAALKLAAEALSVFGFSERTLTAHSAAIPIADYFYRHKLTSTWLTSSSFREDRRAMRRWVVRSLLKAGVWGAGLDTLLTNLRRTIRASEAKGFPVAEMESTMAERGKRLVFSPEEVDALTDVQYGSRAFPLLATLYPGFDGTKSFHVDHVFPRAMFRKKHFAAAGLTSDDDIQGCLERRDGLANLQLLEGSVNISKQESPPVAWMDQHFADEQSKRAYIAAHDLEGITDDLAQFVEFYNTRRRRIQHRLAEALDVDLSDAADFEAPVS